MKYNKSEIMSKAWSLVRRFPEKYNMSSALKKAWARAKARMAEAMEAAEAEQEAQDLAARIAADPVCSMLVAAGGNLWENYGKRRVYLNSNSICALCDGLRDVERNIVDGDRISNNTRRQYLSDMDYSDIYFDLDDRHFHARAISAHGYIDDILGRLVAAVKK